MIRRDIFILGGLVMLILVTTLLGPAEQSLGEIARIIYLHGALVWTAMMAFGVAALLGIIALLGQLGIPKLEHWPHRWCHAAGRVALIFWVTYLPISMWAAHAAWGRVFLQDPSYVRAFQMLAVALIVQVVIWIWARPAWLKSLLNLIPFALMFALLYRPQQLMHPDSPIGDSDSLLIQVYFYLLTAFCALLAIWLGRLLLQRSNS